MIAVGDSIDTMFALAASEVDRELPAIAAPAKRERLLNARNSDASAATPSLNPGLCFKSRMDP